MCNCMRSFIGFDAKKAGKGEKEEPASAAAAADNPPKTGNKSTENAVIDSTQEAVNELEKKIG